MDDAELDRLFELPLAEFVSARNALAKALKKAGQGAEAKTIEKLARPTLPAWVLNQLARTRRASLGTYLAALDRVRAAQLAALSDVPVDGLSLREVMREEREATEVVAQRIEALLQEAGHAASRPAVDRVLRALRGAALDPEGRSRLEAGRLLLDYEASGFGSLAAGIDAPASPPVTSASPAPAPAPADPPIDLEQERRRRDLARQREEEETRRKEAEARREAEERRRAHEQKLEATRRQVAALTEAEQRLASEALAAQRELGEARRRLEEAESTAARLEGRLEEAKSKRREAETQLGELLSSPP